MWFLNLYPLEAHVIFLTDTILRVVWSCVLVCLTILPYRWWVNGGAAAVAETVETCKQLAFRIVALNALTLVLLYAYFLLFIGPVGLWQSAWACGYQCPEFYVYFAQIVMGFFRWVHFVALAWELVAPLVRQAVKKQKGM
jgi:hypothetical protein